eukprot:PITA_17274
MGRCTWVIVAYPSSFSRFRCTVSEKSTSEIFSHFPFFSKSVHPLITNLIWEIHNDGSNMLTKFQIKPIYRLGEMSKTSSGLGKMQQQQLGRADLNVETIVWSLDLARGHLHVKNTIKDQQLSHHAIIKSMHAARSAHNSSRQPFNFESAIVDMYAKCMSMKDARKVFDKMPERDVVSWNAVIAGYAQNIHGEEAPYLLRKMQIADMKLDEFTFSAVFLGM